MAFVVNKLKALRITLIGTLFLCIVAVLFQNCEIKALKNQKLFLPSDVAVIEPQFNDFNEVTSMQKTYRVSFDLKAGEADARMIEGSAISGAAQCDFDFALTAEHVQEIRRLIAAVHLCAKEVMPMIACSGSCPFIKYSFYSDSLKQAQAPVENGWIHVSKNASDFSSQIYFCGGQEKLFEYLKARVTENIPAQCPTNFPVLF